ncbi:MAG TPA: signal recognition particle subunit SRP19/SEC65 family protein [Methanoregulaceae archaeon]|nr:signal recognition particle subunit SRP19/SEC65 family protein [Methanoregulaceae archaeon]
MKGERILYPCYFNAGLLRREGRRVPRSKAVKSPTITDLERAIKKAGLPFRVEQKHHPAYWWKREGRLLVTWDQSKEKLIKKVAGNLEVKK